DFADGGVLQVLAEQLCLSFNIVNEVFVDNNVERCQSRRTAYRVTAEGSDVAKHRVVFDYIHHGFVSHECTNRHAAAHAFRQEQDIWFDAIVLKSKQPARSAEARLDLVENEQSARFVTAMAYGLHIG